MNPKLKAFLVRQAKMLVATAMPILLGAHFLAPQTFGIGWGKGALHELELLGTQLGSAEMIHVVLPQLAALFIWMQKWATSSTPDGQP